MKTKIKRMKKLMSFIGAQRCELLVATEPVLNSLRAKMKKPDALNRECDIRNLVVHYASPLKVHVYTAMESYHNGDHYSRHEEEVPITDEFIDAAIEQLHHVACNQVEADLKRDEQERFNQRVKSRMRELGLDE